MAQPRAVGIARGRVARRGAAALAKGHCAAMVIEDLGLHPDWIDTIGRWHFDQWGALTGAESVEDYVRGLETAARSNGVPSVLVAFSDTTLLGSASLIACDMTIRSALTPWLAQLFVTPAQRRSGVGAALVNAVACRARRCGCDRLYLYTSGALPRYYEQLGWIARERVDYLGKERTVMAYDTVA